jgi:hypothetical protein
MSFPAQIYNHSNDGVTAAIRFRQDTVRDLSMACTGVDENHYSRTLSEYIAEAEAATTRPDSFFRNVCILWQHPTISLPSFLSTTRRFRVTYSGNVRSDGGIAFEGYCVVDPLWFSILLPLTPTSIKVEYFTGGDLDIIQVIG